MAQKIENTTENIIQKIIELGVPRNVTDKLTKRLQPQLQKQLQQKQTPKNIVVSIQPVITELLNAKIAEKIIPELLGIIQSEIAQEKISQQKIPETPETPKLSKTKQKKTKKEKTSKNPEVEKIQAAVSKKAAKSAKSAESAKSSQYEDTFALGLKLKKLNIAKKFALTKNKKKKVLENAEDLSRAVDEKIQSTALGKFVIRKVQKLKKLGKSKEQINVIISGLETEIAKTSLMSKVSGAFRGLGLDKQFLGLSAEEILQKVGAIPGDVPGKETPETPEPPEPEEKQKKKETPDGLSVEETKAFIKEELLKIKSQTVVPQVAQILTKEQAKVFIVEELTKLKSDKLDTTSEDPIAISPKTIDALAPVLTKEQIQIIIKEVQTEVQTEVPQVAQTEVPKTVQTEVPKKEESIISGNSDTDTPEDIEKNNERIYDHFLKIGDIDTANYILDLMTTPEKEDTNKISEIQKNTEEIKRLSIINSDIYKKLDEIEENMVDEQDTSLSIPQKLGQQKDKEQQKTEPKKKEDAGFLESLLGMLFGPWLIKFLKGVGTLAKFIWKIFKEGAKWIAEAFQKLWKAGIEIVQKAWKVITDGLDKAVKFVTESWKAGKEWLLNKITAIKDLVMKGWEASKELVLKSIKWLEDSYNKVRGMIDDGIKVAKEWADNGIKVVKDAWEAGEKWIRDKFSVVDDFITKAKGMIDDGIKVAKEWAEILVNKAKAAIEKTLESIQKILKWLEPAFREVQKGFRVFKEGFKDVLSKFISPEKAKAIFGVGKKVVGAGVAGELSQSGFKNLEKKAATEALTEAEKKASKKLGTEGAELIAKKKAAKRLAKEVEKEAAEKLAKEIGGRGVRRTSTEIAERAAKSGGKKLIKKGIMKGLVTAAKLIPFLGVAITAGTAAYYAQDGWNNADKILGKKKKDLSTADKIYSAGGSVIDDATFGVVPAKEGAEYIRSKVNAVGQYFDDVEVFNKRFAELKEAGVVEQNIYSQAGGDPLIIKDWDTFNQLPAKDIKLFDELGGFGDKTAKKIKESLKLAQEREKNTPASPEKTTKAEIATGAKTKTQEKIDTLDNNIKELKKVQAQAEQKGEADKVKEIEKYIKENTEEMQRLSADVETVATKENVSKDQKMQETEAVYNKTLNSTKTFNLRQTQSAAQTGVVNNIMMPPLEQQKGDLKGLFSTPGMTNPNIRGL